MADSQNGSQIVTVSGYGGACSSQAGTFFSEQHRMVRGDADAPKKSRMRKLV
jgi:hypothetical protein